MMDLITKTGLTGVEFLPVASARRARGPVPAWFELKVTSRTIGFPPLARFGSTVLKPDNRYACPTGDKAGHALLSEAILVRPADVLADFHESTQFVGSRNGLLVPYRVLYISRRTERLLHAQRPRRLYLEIAHFGG